jgi:hypothetical protein
LLPYLLLECWNFLILDKEVIGSLLNVCFEILAVGLRLGFGVVEDRLFFPEVFDRIPVRWLLCI